MPLPSRARVSRAGVHGRKVYFVYASDRRAYEAITRGGSEAPPIGLTVVKEAFHPRVVAEGSSGRDASGRPLPIPGAPASSEGTGLGVASPNIYTPIRDEDGQLVGAGEHGGLYALRYLGEDAPATDDGWIYGTVGPDGEVTSSGVLAQCASCHRDAPHGRLFGVDGGA
jgi:hypothetical protein